MSINLKGQSFTGCLLYYLPAIVQDPNKVELDQVKKMINFSSNIFFNTYFWYPLVPLSLVCMPRSSILVNVLTIF